MKKIDMSPVKHPEKIGSYLKREWKSISVVTVTGTIFNMGMSLIAVWQGHLIDSLVNGDAKNLLIRNMIIFLSIVLVVQVLRYLKRYYVRVFANGTRARMRLSVYDNIVKTDINRLSEVKTGDLMTRAIGDVDLCVEGMRKVTTEVFDTGVLMGTYFVTLLIYDWKCTIPSCLFIPAAMWIADRLKSVITKQTRLARAQSSTVAEYTYDAVENASVYRLNGLDREYEDSYEIQLTKLGKLSVKADILENSMQPVYNVVSLIGAIIVICYGGRNVINGVWTIGMFSAYFVMFLALTTKSSKASKLFNSYQKAVVSWQRVKQYLVQEDNNTEDSKKYIEDIKEEKKDEIEDNIDDNKTRIDNHIDNSVNNNDSLVCSHLSCGWLGTDDPLAGDSDVSFSANRGEIIGITGPVACGKSVLGLALTGLYDYAGSIKLFGRELRDYDQEEERSRLINYMGHMPQLFDTTIEDNITLGNADHGSVDSVLREVCFDIDMQDMPEGVKTTVGSGGIRLSGGQKARAALARALYHRAPVIILDEPFASVDIATEQKIIDNIKRDYRESLVIIISHRLRIFPQTDQILLLEKGKPCIVGNHEQLLKKSELYESIFRLQSSESNESSMVSASNPSESAESSSVSNPSGLPESSGQRTGGIS